MNQSFDVAIIGLGAMGSAAAYHLARQGRRVLGLDRYRPPHAFGSSHGQTRIFRQAYFENPLYVPLIQRAYELWIELEQETGRTLFRQTGCLNIGPPDGVLVSGARQSAELHRLTADRLTSTDVRRRFPIFWPTEEMVAVLEPRAGILFPEACVEAHLEMARRHGARFRFEEPVGAWAPEGEGVRLFTQADGYRAEKLLLTPGPWVGQLLPDLSLPLEVERQVVFWFEPLTDAGRLELMDYPVYIWEYARDKLFYGFPELGQGIKVAFHHQGEITDPDGVRRQVDADEVEVMRALLSRFMPGVNGPLTATTVCLYTNTPDHNFLIDFHPRYPQVLIASPCSGHGFKFSSAIGEILAELSIRGQTTFDLTPFRADRLLCGLT